MVSGTSLSLFTFAVQKSKKPDQRGMRKYKDAIVPALGFEFKTELVELARLNTGHRGLAKRNLIMFCLPAHQSWPS